MSLTRIYRRGNEYAKSNSFSWFDEYDLSCLHNDATNADGCLKALIASRLSLNDRGYMKYQVFNKKHRVDQVNDLSFNFQIQYGWSYEFGLSLIESNDYVFVSLMVQTSLFYDKAELVLDKCLVKADDIENGLERLIIARRLDASVIELFKFKHSEKYKRDFKSKELT